MNKREQIKELALIVNGGLTAYIAVHNEIFEEAATVKSFLKNLPGRGTPMSKLLQDSEALLPLWDAIYQKMEAFRQSVYSTLSTDERYFFDILSSYADALRKTVAALVDRQRLMNEGSKGGGDNAMTWQAYQEKEGIYQLAVQEYMAIGQELNAARPIVFDEDAESITSLDAQCASAFTIVTKTVLDDAHWRAFGYKCVFR